MSGADGHEEQPAPAGTFARDPVIVAFLARHTPLV